MVCTLLCCVVYFSCTVPFSHENVCPISGQHKESFVISKTAPFSSMMTMIMMIITIMMMITMMIIMIKASDV